jgi:hypothetical protein
MQQDAEPVQQPVDRVQDGATREQAAQLDEQLDAETALERAPMQQGWGLGL